MAWITVDQVKLAAGLGPASTTDDEYLASCVAAAETWARRVRISAGYGDDPAPGSTAPDPSVELGTTLYTLGAYRERGAYDGAAAGYDGLGGYEPPGPTLGRIRQLLGIPRPAVA